MKKLPFFCLFFIFTFKLFAQQGLQGEYYTGQNFEKKNNDTHRCKHQLLLEF